MISNRYQVFKSQLTFQVEGVDFFIKQYAIMVMRTTKHEITTSEGLISHLKSLNSSIFWSKLPNAISVLIQWKRWIAFTINESDPIISAEDLSKKIWLNYMNRISLDPWMVCNTSGESKKSHGNDMLNIFVTVCENTIYSLFSLTSWEDKLREDEFKKERDNNIILQREPVEVKPVDDINFLSRWNQVKSKNNTNLRPVIVSEDRLLEDSTPVSPPVRAHRPNVSSQFQTLFDSTNDTTLNLNEQFDKRPSVDTTLNLNEQFDRRPSVDTTLNLNEQFDRRDTNEGDMSPRERESLENVNGRVFVPKKQGMQVKLRRVSKKKEDTVEKNPNKKKNKKNKKTDHKWRGDHSSDTDSDLDSDFDL